MMVEKLEGPFRWARVRGPMSSAIATLRDWNFCPVSFDMWVDLDGRSWILGPKDPNFVGAAKEVLKFHFNKQAWAAITPGGATPGPPDLQPSHQLRKQYLKGESGRHLYFLDAVVQNAMEAHADVHIVSEEGKAICSRCLADIGSQSAWEHFVVGRCAFLEKELDNHLQGC